MGTELEELKIEVLTLDIEKLNKTSNIQNIPENIINNISNEQLSENKEYLILEDLLADHSHTDETSKGFRDDGQKRKEINPSAEIVWNQTKENNHSRREAKHEEEIKQCMLNQIEENIKRMNLYENRIKSMAQTIIEHELKHSKQRQHQRCPENKDRLWKNAANLSKGLANLFVLLLLLVLVLLPMHLLQFPLDHCTTPASCSLDRYMHLETGSMDPYSIS